MESLARQPVLFVSHGGGPWPFIDQVKQMYQKTAAEFSRLSAALPQKPKAIVVVSGHWEEANFTVSSAAQPEMIYDYFGFPAHTYKIKYSAPGSPKLAEEIKTLADRKNVSLQVDPTRGFDHGTFVPLFLMFPEAEIPVVSLSIKSDYNVDDHIKLGEVLQPLRDEGVLIIGSGLNYHNMRGFNTSEGASVSKDFESWLNQTISLSFAERNSQLKLWEAAPSARLAHPREDHLIPLMVVSGAAGQSRGRRLFSDQVMGVAMASYIFDK